MSRLLFIVSFLFLVGAQRTECSSSYKFQGHVAEEMNYFCDKRQEVQTQHAISKPSNCAEYRLTGYTKSGIYTIYPRQWFKQPPFDVFCDMETDGGGWTIFQKRGDFEVPKREDFFRNWNDYANGFGNLLQEFWIGNDKLFVLTNQEYVTLRIDLGDFEGDHRYAMYTNFLVGDKTDNYRLTLSNYHGNAGDSLLSHSNNIFVTHDQNDVNNCAGRFKGGWWYQSCHASNLNGQYLKGYHESFADGINWLAYRGYNYSLKMSEMKLRPTHFKNAFLI